MTNYGLVDGGWISEVAKGSHGTAPWKTIIMQNSNNNDANEQISVKSGLIFGVMAGLWQ